MFEKILQQLKTENKDFGLSETILKVIAEDLAKTVDTEDKIADAVAGVKGQMKIYQSFSDQNRTLQAEITNLKKSSTQSEKKDEEKKEGGESKEAGEIPAWAQAIIDSNKTLSESLTAIKAKETAQTNAEKFQAKLKELKVSEKYLELLPQSTREFANDEEIEAYANDLKTKSDVFEQSIANSALANTPKPLFGEAPKEGEISADAQALIDSKKPKD